MIRKPQFPEDSDRFAKAMVERRKQLETERLVELVGVERRDLERRIERNREATRKAKDALARTRPIRASALIVSLIEDEPCAPVAVLTMISAAARMARHLPPAQRLRIAWHLAESALSLSTRWN